MPLQLKKKVCIVSQNTQNNLETLTKNIQQLEPGFRLARISIEERIVFVHNHINSNGKKNVLIPKNPICTFKYVKKIQDCSWGNTAHITSHCVQAPCRTPLLPVIVWVINFLANYDLYSNVKKKCLCALIPIKNPFCTFIYVKKI